MRLNAAGETLVKGFEKLELVGYIRPGDVPTAGWGHTGPDVEVGRTYTTARCIAWFEDDKVTRERALSKLCAGAATSENQFAAMFSLLYNVGEAAFRKSTVLRLHRAGESIGAAKAFAAWNKARNAEGQLVELRGLTRRRAAEATLYMTPTVEEEAVSPQRTHAPEVEPSLAAAPSAGAGGILTAAGAGTALVAGREAVTQVNSVWSWLTEAGIEPKLASAVLTAAVVAIIGYALFRLWQGRTPHA